MPNKKIIHKNYINNSNVYQLVLPIKMKILIPKDDSIRLLDQILEGLNYEKLYMWRTLPKEENLQLNLRFYLK
jgi:hypothetical protein